MKQVLQQLRDGTTFRIQLPVLQMTVASGCRKLVTDIRIGTAVSAERMHPEGVIQGAP